MEYPICNILFYIFALLAVLFACNMLRTSNPVTSAMSMALCFACVAAILFGLGAQFLGIVQLIVYAGAILVLFLFVVMMLDIKAEEHKKGRLGAGILGAIVAGVFAGMVANIAINLPGAHNGSCPVKALWCGSCEDGSTCAIACADPRAAALAAEQPDNFGGPLPVVDPAASDNDAKMIADTLFTNYNIQFVILSFALLAGTAGAVALARKIRKD